MEERTSSSELCISVVWSRGYLQLYCDFANCFFCGESGGFRQLSGCFVFLTFEDGYTAKIFNACDILSKDDKPIACFRDLKPGEEVLARWSDNKFYIATVDFIGTADKTVDFKKGTKKDMKKRDAAAQRSYNLPSLSQADQSSSAQHHPNTVDHNVTQPPTAWPVYNLHLQVISTYPVTSPASTYPVISTYPATAPASTYPVISTYPATAPACGDHIKALKSFLDKVEQIQPQTGVWAPKNRCGKQELYPESGLFLTSTHLAAIHAEARKDCLHSFHLLFSEFFNAEECQNAVVFGKHRKLASCAVVHWMDGHQLRKVATSVQTSLLCRVREEPNVTGRTRVVLREHEDNRTAPKAAGLVTDLWGASHLLYGYDSVKQSIVITTHVVTLCPLRVSAKQTTFAFQSKSALGKEVESLRAQNASLLHEAQMANKKAMCYSDDLHSAELDLCSHKEELFRLRSEHLAPAQSHSQCDSGFSDSHSSVDERLTPPKLKGTFVCSRFEVLESLAKDIELFDPNNCDQHVDDYLRELDNCLVDLPQATEREKIKLLWKTSSKAVHKFIQYQHPSVRSNYRKLCQAVTEEFSTTADEINSMVAALQIKHASLENPRDYYKRLRHTYCQGKNAPGLEENPSFKSLFLCNLHPCVHTHVVLMTYKGTPSIHVLRKLTQVAWEAAVPSKATGIPTEPASSDPAVSHRSSAPKHHPHNSSKGCVKRQQGDKKRNRYVPQLRRDGHSHNRSCRRPYSEILAQNCDLPIDQSDDEHSIFDMSDCSSDDS
ncbi:hypothetical protein ABVT39_023988 [Epinephelus coioides]